MAEPLIVTGRVVGHDGRPLPAVDVQLRSPTRYQVLSGARADSAGRFAVATTVRGPLFLTAAGVQHDEVLVPLLVDGPGTVAVDVRLGRQRITDKIDTLRVVGEFGHWERAKGIVMSREPDGRYVAVVPAVDDADTVAYQISGLGMHRRVAPMGAERHAYQGGGEYRAVTRARDGKARIVFDVRELVRDTTPGTYAFRDTATRVARFAALDRAIREAERAEYEAYKATAQAGKGEVPFRAGPGLARWVAVLETDADPALRARAAMRVVTLAVRDSTVDAGVRDRATALLRPESPAWAFDPYSAGYLLAQRARSDTSGTLLPGMAPQDSSREARAAKAARLVAYADSVAALPGVLPMIKGSVVGAAITALDGVGPRETTERLFAQLERDYPDTPSLSYLRSRYSPQRAVVVGQPAPDFAFPVLGDTTRTITRAALNGKVVLLDFWATWCAPCVAELPNIQKAYDRLRARGFEIVSVSIDADAATVARFRRDKQPMRWRHTLPPGGFGHAGVKAFQVSFLPRGVLLGRDGTIVAADEELRGDRLIPTLERALGAAPALKAAVPSAGARTAPTRARAGSR